MEALFNPPSLVSVMLALRKALSFWFSCACAGGGRGCLQQKQCRHTKIWIFKKRPVYYACICVHVCLGECIQCVCAYHPFLQWLYNEHMMTEHLVIKYNPEDCMMECMDFWSLCVLGLSHYKICTIWLSWPKELLYIRYQSNLSLTLITVYLPIPVYCDTPTVHDYLRIE